MEDLTFTSPNSMVGSPGEGLSPAASDNLPSSTSAHASASAIPIKKERERPAVVGGGGSHGAPASAPQNHFDMREHEGEFAYVQRRVRKTSVDERRVSFPSPSATNHNRCEF
jgi:GATA-binding protein